MSRDPGPRSAGLLLAAGGGSRFGGAKALASFRGEPLVRRVVRLLHDGGCAPVVVVLGAQADEVAAVLEGEPTIGCVRSVVAADWRTGMGASLRTGIEAVSGEPVDAVVIALVDQPLVGAEAIRRLRAAHAAGATAAVATYADQPRNPVLLDRAVWPEVAAAAGQDVGARSWLRAHPQQVVSVPCDGTGIPDDADVPADLRRLEQHHTPDSRRRAGPKG
ncbi:MAG TPA: nucleotidyltransferase family protein [Mycobacteriales bacterium]|nr:nucleotidyltransferase family protein [Mycobacteriales bacterium]